MLSNGDTSGLTFHADFVNGVSFPPTALRRALADVSSGIKVSSNAQSTIASSAIALKTARRSTLLPVRRTHGTVGWRMRFLQSKLP